jgi:hypothetical protein
VRPRKENFRLTVVINDLDGRFLLLIIASTEVNMPRTFCIVLLTGLMASAPVSWARGGGGPAGGGPGGGGAVGAGHGHGTSNAAAHASPSAITHSNGLLSPNREHGIERAEDQMSTKGLENTNGPMSPSRSKGRARADQRHDQNDALSPTLSK